MKYARYIIITLTSLVLSLSLQSCGFRLQGEMHLAEPLKRLYLETPDPYGQLARYLEQYLTMSHVKLVSSPAEATAILRILTDTNSQSLLSVSATQQTRQYNLSVTTQFEINDARGRPIIQNQTLSESRALTIQSNQILGSNNEAVLIYQQIRRSLAYAIVNRLASREVSQTITKQTSHQKSAPRNNEDW